MAEKRPRRQPKKKTLLDRLWVRLLLYLLAIPIALYVVLVIAVFFLQDALLFYPQATELTDATIQSAVNQLGAEEIRVAVTDDVELHGFFLPGTGANPRRTILYFGGNAESLRPADWQPMRRRGWNVALVAYRGYGRSEGDPSGDAIQADGLVIREQIAARPDVDADRIVVWGRSIGTGVAVKIAAEAGAQAVILESPYARLSNTAAHHYPWLPVRMLFRHEIDSASRAKDIDAPALILHGTRDVVIPLAEGKRLVEAWNGDVTFHEVEGAGHNDLQNAAGYLERQLTWLDTHVP